MLGPIDLNYTSILRTYNIFPSIYSSVTVAAFYSIHFGWTNIVKSQTHLSWYGRVRYVKIFNEKTFFCSVRYRIGVDVVFYRELYLNRVPDMCGLFFFCYLIPKSKMQILFTVELLSTLCCYCEFLLFNFDVLLFLYWD